MRRYGRAALVSTLVLLASSTAHAQGSWLPYGNTGASDVAINPSGVIWLIGREPHSIRSTLILGITSFATPRGNPAHVAVDLNGFPWLVNSDGTLWHFVRNTGTESWVQQPVHAIDVAVGANGAVWAIGTDQHVMKLNGDSWGTISGNGAKIAVDPSGNPWVINSAGQISKYSGTSWTIVPGPAASDITISPDGTVFVLGPNRVPGGFEILRLDGSAWQHIVGGGATAIAAGPRSVYVAQDSTTNLVLMSTNTALRIDPQASAGMVAVSPSATKPVLIDAGSATAQAAAATGASSGIAGPNSSPANSSAPVPSAATPSSSAPAASTTSTTVVVQQQAGSSIAGKTAGAIGGLLGGVLSAGGKVAEGAAGAAAGAAVGAAAGKVLAPPLPVSVALPGVGGLISSAGGLAANGASAATSAATSPSTPNAPKAPQKNLGVKGKLLRPLPHPPVPGSLLCPIIGTGAKLEKGCSMVQQAARMLRPAPPTECSEPSFLDPQNGSECWSCPASYVRNANSVDAKGACMKPAIENLSKAVQAAIGADGKCASPSISDTTDSARCWSCPTGFTRTQNSIGSDSACAQVVGAQFSTAIQKDGCSLFKALAGFGTAFRKGGACWACPLGLVRSIAGGSSNTLGDFASCVAGGKPDQIVWQLGQYPESGVYRFMPGLLKMALADPKAVDAFLSIRANGDTTLKQKLWADMIADPAGSAELKALLFASLLTAAKQPDAGVEAASALHDFETYMRDRRLYVATEAMRMYNKWQEVHAVTAKLTKRPGDIARVASGIAQAARDTSSVGVDNQAANDSVGSNAIDYKGLAWSGAIPDSAGAAFVVASAALSRLGANSAVTAVNNAATSFNVAYLAPVTSAFENGIDLFQEKRAQAIQGATTLSNLPGGAYALKRAEGAMIGTSLVSRAIDFGKSAKSLVEKGKAAREYAAYVAEMKQLVSVKQMLDSSKPEDLQKLLLYWALATSPYKASDKIGTGRLTSSELCSSNAWTAEQCTLAKSLVAAAAAKAAEL